MTCVLELDRLAATIAAVPVQPKHLGLIEALRSIPEVAHARLLTNRSDARLFRRKVLSAEGELNHDDHEAWLKLECANDGGNLSATRRRLRGLNHRLTECAIDTLYVVHDCGGARHDDFAQLTVNVESTRPRGRATARWASDCAIASTPARLPAAPLRMACARGCGGRQAGATGTRPSDFETLERVGLWFLKRGTGEPSNDVRSQAGSCA